MAKVEGQTVMKLATEITKALKSTAKNDPTTPKILQAALDRLGSHYGKAGDVALGEIISDQLLKATGETLTPLEAATFHHSPMVVHKFLDLLTRVSIKSDERQSLDVSGLSEEDLVGSLTSLVMDMIETNEEYRRMAVMAAIKKQPDLIHEAMTVAGLPVVDALAKTTIVEDDDNDYASEAVEDED